MKNYKAILAALLLGASPAAWAQYSAGTNALAQGNIVTALNDFTNAVKSAPTNPTNNVYLALTRLLALPNDSATTSFLTHIGFSTTGRDIYKWQAAPHKNANGHVVLLTNFNVEEIPTELAGDVVPTLIASETNLAKVTDTTFTLFMPRSVTHFGGDVTLDYGDVQMLRAMADAATVFGYEINTLNLNAKYGTASNIVHNDNSINAVLTNFPALLEITNSGDFALARAAFTNAITRYMAASAFIRARPSGGPRYLFNLDANDLTEEANFRTTLTELENSLNGFVAIGSGTNYAINMGNFFSGSNSVRSLLPTQTASRAGFIWDNFPDTTLGGVITGLTQTNLGKVFLKDFHEYAQLDLSNVAFTVVSAAGSSFNQSSLNGVVLGTDGNFYGTVSYGGTYSSGGFFRATPSGGFSLLYSFGGVTNRDGSPADGGSPSSLALGSGGSFYGTTSYGGDKHSGTIFTISGNGRLTNLYNFGDGNDYSASGGNPLLLANGTFYGATQYGGTNGAGIIFQFIPPSVNGANGGNFTTLCSLPSAPVPNPMASGAGAGALVLGSDGNFYGVTQFGGTYGGGSIFQFVPGATGVNGGTFNTLYSFPQINSPFGTITPGVNTLVQGSNGIFYGTTQYGGANSGNGSGGQGDGSLFCIDMQGNFTNLYSFDENEFDGFGPIGAMVQGTNGAFYGITSSGGANQDGTIFKFTPGAAAPDFIVWFDEALGTQQSEQNGYNNGSGNYNNTVNVGLIKAAGAIYGTAPNSGPAKNDNGTLFSIAPNNNFPPSILTSPASTNRALGSTVTLSVSASGSGTLTYQWIKGTTPVANNGTHITGATTANLTLTGLLSTDAGSYHVVVANSYGKANSAVAALTVILPATITLQPTNSVNIEQGGTVSLTVGSGGTGPFTYQWLSNNAALSDGGNISGALTSNLVISQAVTTDSAGYSVIVANSVSSTNSKVSVVTVGTPPYIVTSPASATNVAGHTATLTVTASGGGLRYQWFKGTAPVANSAPHISGATSNILTFTGLLLSDAGSYYAMVTNTYGKAPSAVAVLTVVQGPTITNQPATPVNLVQGEALSLTVGASGGSLAYQWLSNSVALSDGGNVLGSATRNLVISPAVTNDSANYSVIVSNSVSFTNSHVSVVTVAVDKALPAVTITNIYSGYPRLSAPVTFGGAASETNPKGNVPIANVNYWITNLNGALSVQGPFAANLSAGLTSAAPSNWTATLVSPPAGSNIFAVRSYDFSGNPSPLASLKFFLKSPAPLALATDGTGTGRLKGTALISGDTNAPANNALLNVGEAYAITETPSNSFFVNWTVSGATAIGATTNPTLNFIMENNASITANFITNIFIGMAGTYNGLFSSDPQGVTENTAGMIGNLVVSPTGAYTGKLFLGEPSAYSLATPASFTPGGYATNVVATTSAIGKVEVVMQMNAGSSPRTITGFVTGTNPATRLSWNSDLYLVASASPASNRLDALNYTLLIPPAAASPITTPTGYGYALLTNYPGSATVPGFVTFSGGLADGQPYTQNVPIAEDNMIPVCIYPYTTAAPGLLWGRLNLSSTPTLAGLAPAPSGDLTWIKQASTSGLFKAGFTNTSLAVVGSPWSNSVPLGTVILPGSQLILSNANSTVLLDLDVSVSNTNLVTTPATANYSASVNTNNGRLTVTVTNGTGTSKVILNGRGAVLQDSGTGGGYFLLPSAGTTNAGSVLLLPP